jgi:hypothetical protein
LCCLPPWRTPSSSAQPPPPLAWPPPKATTLRHDLLLPSTTLLSPVLPSLLAWPLRPWRCLLHPVWPLNP